MSVTMKNMRHISPISRSKGLSLVELMVAITLGLLLIAGVLQIYVGSKATYRAQDALSRLQENQRFAMNLLATNIRPAGYAGCLNVKDKSSVRVIANPPTPTINASTAIQGHENKGGQSWSPNLPTGITQVLDDTDVLVLQHGGTCGAKLTGNMGTTNANIQINADNSCGFTPGEAILITDCSASDLFRANNVSEGTLTTTIAHSSAANTATDGTNSNFLSKPYTTDSEILKFTSVAYFIRNGVSGTPSLWRYDMASTASGSNPVELVEGVENLQVLYGEDAGADGEADQYVVADAVGDWADVVSVRVTLLFRTIETVNTVSQTYSFEYDVGASSKDYTDRFSRQQTTMTIDLRNKGSYL